MLEFLDDANEDSAASIVEERRFEDGQPSKIRLRLVQLLIRQLLFHYESIHYHATNFKITERMRAFGAFLGVYISPPVYQ